MKTLEQLIEDLAAAEKVAATDLNDVPPATRGGWTSRVREATDTLKKIRQEYGEALFRNGVAIFLEGAPAKVGEAAKIFEQSNGLVADADALYDRLTQMVEPTVAHTRTWGIAQTHRFHLGIQEVMHELNIQSIPMPSTRNMPFVATSRDTFNYIKAQVRGVCGDNLSRLYLAKAIVDRAIKIRYTGVTVPVMFVNAPAEEHATLANGFGKGHTTAKIEDSDAVNEEFLGKLLKEAAKKIRGKK